MNQYAGDRARKLIFRPQDPVVNFRYTLNDGQEREYDGKLSGVPKWLIDRAKKPLYSHDRGHIDDMLRVASSENALDRKIGDEDAAVLVVVGPTEDSGFNPLVHVADRIKKLFGDVAITAESSDGPAAAAAVKEFKRSTARWIVAKS